MKKDFLAVSDYSPAELQEMLDLAVTLKKEHFNGGNKPLFQGKTLAMVFQKPSLRTRAGRRCLLRTWPQRTVPFLRSPPKNFFAAAPNATTPISSSFQNLASSRPSLANRPALAASPPPISVATP